MSGVRTDVASRDASIPNRRSVSRQACSISRGAVARAIGVRHIAWVQYSASPLPAWPVRVRAVEHTAGGAVLWRYRGGVVLTAIAKVTLAWVPDGPMRPVAGAELHFADQHAGGDVRRSLLASSDVAPHRPKADVLVTGHAVVAGAGLLRVALSGERVVLDKTISVVDHGPASMQAPARVPISYEEALGGPTREDNPAGTATPRLLDPSNPALVACFAPVPQSWPARNRLLGGLDRRALDGVHLDVPPAIDWSFFQAAPPDQRVDLLRGDEWLLLSGHAPGQPVLPDTAPLARRRRRAARRRLGTAVDRPPDRHAARRSR